eukprot:TRINITY_DN33660_c0_g1_i1.p1 TRINITY_DN33660_c0_g1~~TRINITY_DN33660_c0_g1_i1.p1  ORF type:complete len:102 (+),score=0.28 TRINITY_DN33660_c0_g1_i1:115-420(+)
MDVWVPAELKGRGCNQIFRPLLKATVSGAANCAKCACRAQPVTEFENASLFEDWMPDASCRDTFVKQGILGPMSAQSGTATGRYGPTAMTPSFLLVPQGKS